MTEQELKEAREQVEFMEWCAGEAEIHFEIAPRQAGLLARYIRELERQALRRETRAPVDPIG